MRNDWRALAYAQGYAAGLKLASKKSMPLTAQRSMLGNAFEGEAAHPLTPRQQFEYEVALSNRPLGVSTKQINDVAFDRDYALNADGPATLAPHKRRHMLLPERDVPRPGPYNVKAWGDHYSSIDALGRKMFPGTPYAANTQQVEPPLNAREYIAERNARQDAARERERAAWARGIDLDA